MKPCPTTFALPTLYCFILSIFYLIHIIVSGRFHDFRTHLEHTHPPTIVYEHLLPLPLFCLKYLCMKVSFFWFCHNSHFFLCRQVATIIQKTNTKHLHLSIIHECKCPVKQKYKCINMKYGSLQQVVG